MVEIALGKELARSRLDDQVSALHHAPDFARLRTHAATAVA